MTAIGDVVCICQTENTGLPSGPVGFVIGGSVAAGWSVLFDGNSINMSDADVISVKATNSGYPGAPAPAAGTTVTFTGQQDVESWRVIGYFQTPQTAAIGALLRKVTDPSKWTWVGYQQLL